MHRRRLHNFAQGDIVIEPTTGRIGKVLRRGEQVSEVRWQDGSSQYITNKYLTKREE